MVEMTGLDKTSLVSFFLYKSCRKFKEQKSQLQKYIQKTNNNPKQGGSETKPL